MPSPLVGGARDCVHGGEQARQGVHAPTYFLFALLPACMSEFPFNTLHICLSLCPSVRHISVSVHLSAYPPVRLPVYLLVYPPVLMSTQSVYLSVFLSVQKLAYLPVHAFVHLSVPSSDCLLFACPTVGRSASPYSTTVINHDAP